MLIGWDIGGTKCAVVTGRSGENGPGVLERRETQTPAPWQAALKWLTDTTKELSGAEKIDAIGISCGGPLDSARGVIQSPPNLPGWDDVPIVRMAEEALGAPAYLENDANACALAEWRCGAGRGCESMVFLTFGTGLGAGLILDGRLLRGATGNAGEAGHIRLSAFGPSGYGKPGSFEGFCSGGGIAQLAETIGRSYVQSGRTPGYRVPGATAKDVTQAAYAGDAAACAVMEQCGEMLGRGLALLCDILDPERIVIGSIFRRAESLLRPAMERALNAEALGPIARNVRVVPAGLGENVGDIAALCAAEYGLRGENA